MYFREIKQVLEPANTLQCVFAQGIIAGWKLPIYVEFGVKATKELLDKIIISLENSRFRVRACAFGMGNKDFLGDTGTGLSTY